MLNKFKSPDNSYRGTDFWMLNDKLDNDEIISQLKQMHSKGVHSILARTFSGLVSDYPGKGFIKTMHIITDTAKELGMNVIVQAKYMPECIENLPAEYAISHIVPIEKEKINTDDEVIFENETTTFIKRKSNNILDIFDRTSVDFYIKECYEDMWSEFADEYGKTITSVWVDEPAFGRTNLPWPHNFEKLFFDKYGYSISENVEKLYLNTEGYEKVRFDYHTFVQSLLTENYFKPLNDWCKKNKLMASGHLLGEDSLKLQLTQSCGAMPFYKYFDIPGTDILTMKANWHDTPIKQKHGDEYCDIQRMYLTPIQIMSAVKQYGNDEHVLCEMYGVSTQNMTFQNQRYLFDYFAAFGINHRSVHGMFYSLRGRRKRGYPPHINYYQPYWYKYDKMIDYVARVSQFARFGKPDTKVLLLHPYEHSAMLYQGNLLKDRNRELDEYDLKFHNLIKSMKTLHCDFDLGDSPTIKEFGKLSQNNEIIIGNMAYKTVVLPDISVITKPAFKLLKSFSKKGGKVICLGNAPCFVDSEKYDTAADIDFLYVKDISELSEQLKDYTSYHISGADMASHIIVNHRNDNECDYFMLMNTDCAHKKRLTLSVEGVKKAILWNAENGSTQELAVEYDNRTTILNLTVDAGSSVLLSFENGKCNIKKSNSKALCASLDDNWKVKRENDNVLLLEYCRFKTESDGISPEMPVLAANEILYRKGYNGKLYMEFSFESECAIKGLKLALEEPENCRIYFNETEIKNTADGYYLAKQFRIVPLPDLCRVGKNTISIELDYTPLTNSGSELSSIFATSSGTEPENMYLLGDFCVSGIMEHNLNGCLRYNRHFKLCKEKDSVCNYGDLTIEGYPFYAGIASLEREFELDDFKSCCLCIENLRCAVSEVYINGRYCGDIYRSNSKIDCTGFVKKGKNTVTLKLANTLRNLFGPHHRAIGERGNTFTDTPGRSRGCYGYFDEAWVPIDISTNDWFKKIDTDSPVWTPSYNLVPFGAEGIYLEISL